MAKTASVAVAPRWFAPYPNALDNRLTRMDARPVVAEDESGAAGSVEFYREELDRFAYSGPERRKTGEAER